MLEFLQTGKAIYVLAAICLVGIASKLAARNLYKRLIKEAGNMMLTKDRWMRSLRQRAEDTYRLNQGISNTRTFVERQMFEAKMGLFTPEGWSAFSNQMTVLCFLAGGAAAFMSYWFRCDSYYIVLYSSAGLLTGGLNIMADYGAGLGDKRQWLCTAIQDYLENTLWKRLSRDRLPELENEKKGIEAGHMAGAKEPVRLMRGRKREMAAMEGKAAAASGNNRVGQDANSAGPKIGISRKSRGQSEEGGEEKLVSEEALSQLRKSLEQAAVGRSGQPTKMQDTVSAGENWMKDLKPEEIKVLGEIIREYLG